MSKTFQFVTGATGFVGSALVLELLSRTEAPIVCLVRAEDSIHAHERLQSALLEAALLYERERLVPEIFSRCIAITGSLLEPGFGAELAHYGRPTDFWHCAASLEFEEARAREIFLNNFQGTRNVLDVAKQLGAERFLHISTAYVAGKRCGVIPEEAPRPELGFQNTYEESKAATERMLLEEREIEIYILRPSIVIGHSRTFATTSNAGVYGFMREMYRLQRRFERSNAEIPPIRLSGKDESIFSVIPVDLLAAEAVSISLSATEDRIFHITRRNQTTAIETIQLMCNELGLPRPAIVALGEPLDPVSEMLMNRLTFSKPYLSGYKRFCTKHTDAVTGGAEAEELDALPFTRWYREYLVAQDSAGARNPRAQVALSH